MKKLLKMFIAFLILSSLMMLGAYVSFHCILKEDIFNEWYEYLCYGACVIGAAYYVYELNKDE
jgi:hypothetical protein